MRATLVHLKCGVLVSVLIIPPAIAADQVQCPLRVEVQQEISRPVQGWIPAVDQTPHRLAGITFFDGESKEQASLAPGPGGEG